MSLITNYFLTSFRSFKKSKLYTLVNISGLAIGFFGCLAIGLYVIYESSYDSFLSNHENTYRASMHSLRPESNRETFLASSPAPLAPALREEFPEVEAATRLTRPVSQTIQYKDIEFTESSFLFADENFFLVFRDLLKYGDAEAVLNRPNTVVITEAMADKYFAKENPIGEILTIDDVSFEVTGVSKAIPENSHFEYDFLGSLKTEPERDNGRWFSNNFFTYLVLDESVSKEEFQDKLYDMVGTYLGAEFQNASGRSLEDVRASGGDFGYTLTRISDIHLNSKFSGELKPSGNIQYMYILGIVALLLLGIAIINYVNMATAQSDERVKEIGVRKALGAGRLEIFSQYISQSVLISFLASLIGILIIILAAPYLQNLTGVNYLSHFSGNIPELLLFVFLVVLISSLSAGMYPGYLAVKLISTSTHGKPVSKKQFFGLRLNLRSLLLGLQITFSIGMIASTFIIWKQLDYLLVKDLGFDKEEVMVISNGYSLREQLPVFKENVERYSGIEKVSIASSVPGRAFSDTNFEPIQGSEESFTLKFVSADVDFVHTMGLNLIEGRSFSNDMASDSLAIILNQTAISEAGWENPIGEEIIGSSPFGGEDIRFKVIGVVEDFNFESLYSEVRPFGIILNRGTGMLALRLASNSDMRSTISKIEKEWGNYRSDLSMNFYFLDDRLQSLYEQEQKVGKTFLVFSMLSIFIALMGLFSLASLLLERFKKEIGIRRILGAEHNDIVKIFSKQFFTVSLISFFIAIPIVHYLLSNWLQNFAYRTEIDASIYMLTFAAVLILIVSSIGYHIFKAAKLKPIEVLKND